MKTNDFKKESGVTLVALIVTIVVLLILSGVSLNLAVSGDGIIKKTIDASEAYNDADIKEKVDSAYQQAIIGQVFSNDDEKIRESIENNLKKHYEGVTVTKSSGAYEVNIPEKGDYTVTDSGTTKN